MSDHPKKKSTRENKRRPTIAVFADSMTSGYQIQIWQGIRDAAKQHDVNLMCFIGRELDYEYEYRVHANNVYNLVNAHQIDGIISYTATISHFVDDQRINQFLHQFKIPVVGIAQETENVPTLLMDNYMGVREIVTHLIEGHGYQKIAFYKTTDGHPEGEERYRAYQETLASHSLPFDPDLVVPGNYFNFPAEGMKLLLDERKVSFDAIVAVDDYTALPIQEILKARGFKVPEDVAVVGFDDVEDCRFVTPPMTTVRQPLHQQGERALQIILSQINGEKVDNRIILSPELIVRQSCGCLHPDILKAASESAPGATPTGTLADTRNEIIEKIQTDFSELSVKSFGDLFDAFIEVLGGQPAGQFLTLLNNTLSEDFNKGADIAPWQSILSSLRNHAIPYLEPGDSLGRAENLFQQSRVMVADVGQRAQAQRRLIAQNQAATFRGLSQAISTTLDFKNLGDIIINNLPNLEIPECYISLYRNQNPRDEVCNLVLAYTPKGRTELPLEGLPYPREQIIPERFLQSSRRFTFMVEPLYFQDESYGFILLETSASDETVYDALAQQISSALKGVRLVEQVEKRALQLQTASEVSRSASSILDPDALIQSTVELVRERFDLYYAGIFLVEETGKWAVLQAGTGEAAQQMIAQNWKLDVGGASMIGRCVSTGTADIQLDVDKAPVHLRNPYLQETRSEMALPLISRGETIGALSIQSEKPQAFTLEDAEILQTMANQIASAIQNTRLYNQTQSALEEIQATQRRYLQQAWSVYNKTAEKTGYMKADANVIPLGDEMLPEVQQAMREKRPVVVKSSQEDEPFLAIPILLRDQPIGALGFRLPPGKQAWSEDAIAIAEAVSEQFGLAAETIRLLEETQRRAARERLVSEITTKIRSTNDPQEMLQTAVFELRQALQAKRAQAILQPENDGLNRPKDKRTR